MLSNRIIQLCFNILLRVHHFGKEEGGKHQQTNTCRYNQRANVYLIRMRHNVEKCISSTMYGEFLPSFDTPFNNQSRGESLSVQTRARGLSIVTMLSIFIDIIYPIELAVLSNCYFRFINNRFSFKREHFFSRYTFLTTIPTGGWCEQ